MSADERTTRPERYVVYWYDWNKQRRIAAEGIDYFDPSDFEEMRDFDTMEEARRFLASPINAQGDTAEDSGGYIEERVNIHWTEMGWEWDQERID